MWLRCRNSLSAHEASIPVELVESGAMPDWTPLEGAEPSDTFEDATYDGAPATGQPATPTTPPADQSGTPENQGE